MLDEIPVRTGGEDSNCIEKVYAVMDLFILLFFLILAIASAMGLTADSRDFADWKPTDNGGRWRARRS